MKPGIAEPPTATAASVLQVRDGRTGREHELAIADGAIRATDLLGIGEPHTDHPGLMSYDPAFMNTASCRSAITYIDGDAGILRYRGYPIEQLAERLNHLDVAWLLINGELPDAATSADWAADVAGASELPREIVNLVATFPADAHPMAVLLAAWSALGAFHPEAKSVDDAAARDREVPRFLGSIASLVALVFRHRTGRPLDAPDTEADADYAARLLGAMFPESPNRSNRALARAVDVLLILQADHEQNASTNAVRAVGSTRVDPYSATAAGIAALYGPLHGGANEAVVRMLHDIGSVDRVPAYIESVKHGERKLMGFGHRVYKSYDPRAKIIRRTAEEVFAVTGTNPLLDVALAVERVALEDDYFVSRKLYPNVDFYSGLIYEAMGLPPDTYTTIFAVARMAGWVAQWLELIVDPEQKIARPRQIYTGPGERPLAEP
ncbi:MAG TPA: citrate/2-methylcitrate synthase [Candidatus Limnocylindrales bacterium]|nr:citrate/2-methylcitrate synthase [Candidatus Limnocylindrales bacterium]